MDRVVVRLTANGAVDTTFGTKGINTLNIGNLGDSPRNGFVQPDGKIISSGYMAAPTGVGTQMSNRVVVHAAERRRRALDTTFGSKGMVNSNPFQPADPINTEWGHGRGLRHGYQGGKYVTTGYGRAATSGAVDLVSFRSPARASWTPPGAPTAVFTLDVVGDNDRGRNLVVLPDNRVLMHGQRRSDHGQHRRHGC